MSKYYVGVLDSLRSRVILIATVATAVLLVAAVAYVSNTSAVAPADYGLKEGDTISAAGSDDPDVYIVNDWGYKRLFLNPVIFGFYGHLGGFAKVKNVSPVTRDAFPTSGLFRNCETNDPKVYGVETTGEDVGMLHWVNTSGAQAVADDPNFFKKVFCINSNEFNWYPKGSDYTSVNQVPNYVRVPGATPVPTGPLSVSLAPDNPSAGTLVKSQALADLAHFTFTGNGTVTSLKFKRLGVSADSDLTNVYLYDGTQRLTDAAGVSNGEISFNDTAGLFMVSGSKNISVRADLSGNSGNTVGVQLVSFNGNTVNLSGNLHAVANATLATVTITDNTDPSSNSSLQPANDVTAWRQTVTVSPRSVYLRGIQFRVVGSVLSGDLKNFRLYIAGSQVGSAVSQPDSNGYVNFDLGSGYTLPTGSREVKVMVDVINGSGRNFTVSLRQYADMFVVDSQYGQPIVVTTGGSFTIDGGQQTIASGELTIIKMNNSPSGDVIKDASGVTLASFEFRATGERMKVENLRITFDESDNNVSELRNGAIFADDGAGGPMTQIGSTQDILETSNGVGYTQYSLGSSLIVEPGKPRMVAIMADVADGDGTDDMTAGETLKVSIAAGSSNVQRLTTLDFISRPSSAVDGNTLTIKTGSFTAARYSGYANQSMVSPSTGVKLAHFTLTAASTEDMNVNTINLDSDTSGGTFEADDLRNVYLKVMNDSGSVIYTSVTKSELSKTASNSYSVSFTLPKTKTYQVEVWGDIASGVTAGHYMNLEIDATGITTGSATSVTASEADGQRITVQTGTLTVANGSLETASLRVGGSQGLSTYQFTMQPAYDNFWLDEVYVDLSSTLASSTGAVAMLKLFDGSTQIGSATVNPTTASASFTGLNVSLPQSGGTKTFTVRADLAQVGPGANDTGGNVTVRLDGYKYRTGTGSVSTVTGLAPATYTGNANIVHKSYPVFANQSLPTTTLAQGTQTLLKTKISSADPNSNISFKKIKFSVTVPASGPTVAESSLKVFEDGVDITSLGTVSTASYDLDTTTGGTAVVTFVLTNERAIGSSGHVYELKGTVGGTVAGKYITSKIDATSTSATTEDYATVAATSATFVWSDMSAVSHGTLTDDWMNDYLIRTINESQSMSAGT